jgi:hypothetical protein
VLSLGFDIELPFAPSSRLFYGTLDAVVLEGYIFYKDLFVLSGVVIVSWEKTFLIFPIPSGAVTFNDT